MADQLSKAERAALAFTDEEKAEAEALTLPELTPEELREKMQRLMEVNESVLKEKGDD